MSSYSKVQAELTDLKYRIQKMNRKVDLLLGERDSLIGDIQRTNKMVGGLSNQVEALLKEANKIEGPTMQPGRLHQSDVLLTGQNIQGMLDSAEVVAPFEVKEEDGQDTAVLKDAVVSQMSIKLAELLDVLGFGKEHVQKHGLDQTVYDACLYIQSLKGGESLLNNLRSILK